MPDFSTADWETMGTDEADIRDSETVSPAGPFEPDREGRFSSMDMGSGAVDPQPFNPNYQLQTGITDWINVRSIGATGNGVVDDTGFFQAANLIAQQPPGRMVYIPAGIYKLTANVVMSAGVQWLMMGTVTGGFTISGGTQIQFGTTGMTNPMTSTGDVIIGGAGGVPMRLGVSANGQVLTLVSGSPAWAAASSGFTNPMTTPGDLITGGASGTPQRLGVGGSSQVLGVSGGAPAWVNPSSGFTNPMTTTGDIIYSTDGSGDAGRLGIGTNGQVLTVLGGIPVWLNSPAGFANPMTAKGDLIYSTDSSGDAGRLGIGTAGQVLGISSGAPAWVTPGTTASLPFVTLIPSGDTSGASDFAAFTAAQSALPKGGVIFLAPGIFYTNAQWVVKGDTSLNATQNNKGQPICLQGSPSTIICGVGTFTTGVISYHRDTSYGAQYGHPANPSAGFIRDLVIDGTYATGASVGLDVGDARGFRIDVTCQNFDGTNQVGAQIINRLSWTEKSFFRMEFYNNTTACILTTAIPGSDHSNEYNDYDFTLFANQNQNGIVVDGTNQGGCNLWLKGNMCQTPVTSGAPTGNVAALTIRNTTGANNSESRWYFGSIWMKVEGNATTQYPPTPPTNGVFPYGIYMDGVARGIQQCTGFITHSLTPSNINNSEFTFAGAIGGDTNLSQAFPSTPGSQNTVNPGTQPTIPATGVVQQNYGPDAMVCVSGGTVSGVTVNGQPTGLTSGTFLVRAGASITVNYTAAPSYVWVPAAQMTY